MRIWHKYLVGALPKPQLKGEWRELCLMAKNIKLNNSPNHLLVNKTMKYDISHFFTYCKMIAEEMRNRNIRVNENLISKYFGDAYTDCQLIEFEDLFAGWHNNRYLIQCFFNLEEKYDCGGITESEWILFVTVAHKLMEEYDE